MAEMIPELWMVRGGGVSLLNPRCVRASFASAVSPPGETAVAKTIMSPGLGANSKFSGRRPDDLLRMGLSVGEMPGNLPVPQRSSLFAY